MLRVLLVLVMMAVTTTAEGTFHEVILQVGRSGPTTTAWVTATSINDPNFRASHEPDWRDVKIQARWRRRYDWRPYNDVIEFRMQDPSFVEPRQNGRDWLLQLYTIQILDNRDSVVAFVPQDRRAFERYLPGYGRLYVWTADDGYPFDETTWDRPRPTGALAQFLHESGEIGRDGSVFSWALRNRSDFNYYCSGGRTIATSIRDCKVKLTFILVVANHFISLQNLRQWLITYEEERAEHVQKLAGVRDSVSSLQTELSEVKEACDENAIRGDFNGDGRVNFSDFLIFVGLYEADN